MLSRMANMNTYFAYGERDPQLMAAIIGRPTECRPAVLTGYRLCVQSIVGISPRVREILAANRTEAEMAGFEVYAAVPDEESIIKGIVTEVTDEELGILDNWDVEGLWFQRVPDRPVHLGIDASRLGRATAHALPEDGAGLTEVAGYDDLFPPAINDPIRTRQIAAITREAFLANL